MYIPKIFKNENPEEIEEFIRQNSFGILVSLKNGIPLATHIPIELEERDGKKVLCGHLARANEQWRSFDENKEVLTIFIGPHAYISASWYKGESVPTWNYVAVHVYGKIRIIEGQDLWQSLKKLVDKYEQASENPVSIETMSEKMVENQMRAIVGFEIEITDIQAKYKLSQNRNPEDYQRVVEHLQQSPDPIARHVSELMQKD
ncbi:FMN-binding negative transcriptional regulator [Emticicia sp. C21]|uniref:FMN-binding negative transcriptional regulator n=1 Tax=Emticicia sp. C21 TaxID=2302915 RepID=UPI000E356269|nr:FMN-binding negative transcriptional regulator [Emticicia sp. C21]RFS15410.1 FMN-binding negative transcriptional regulator [Emticicia sp. C21]